MCAWVHMHVCVICLGAWVRACMCVMCIWMCVCVYEMCVWVHLYHGCMKRTDDNFGSQISTWDGTQAVRLEWKVILHHRTIMLAHTYILTYRSFPWSQSLFTDTIQGCRVFTHWIQAFRLRSWFSFLNVWMELEVAQWSHSQHLCQVANDRL